MKSTYQSIQSQIAKLQEQADKARAEEVAGVVSRIKEAISVYGLTESDLFGRVAGKKSAGATRGASRAAKYSDGNGNEWGGRGPRPAWLREALAAGKQLEEFDVNRARSGRPAAQASLTRKPGRKAKGKSAVPAKYRDQAGNTWTGRGNKPRWLSAAIAAGAKVEDFLIAS